MESYRKSHGRWPENAPWPVLSVACEPSSVQQNDSMALRTTLSPYLNADDSMELSCCQHWRLAWRVAFRAEVFPVRFWPKDG